MALNRILTLTLAAIFVPPLCGGCIPTPASAQVGSREDAFRQQAVDALLARIGDTVGTSLQTEDWRGRYRQAGINIEDLRKALQVGGKVTYDPIAPFKAQLDELWAERYEYWTFLHGTLLQLLKQSKAAREQAVRDVGGAMMRFLTPKPGLGTLANAARTKDAEVIKRDFAEIKSTEQAIKIIRGYIEDMKKNMNDLKARREELLPVHAALKALMGGGEGTFKGRVMWEHPDGKRTYEGEFKLVITGQQVTGNFAVLDGKQGDEIRMKRSGEVNGKLNPDGTINADIIKGSSTCVGKCDGDTGALVKSILGFPFRGKLDGRLNGNLAEGRYNVHSIDQREKPITSGGTWSATRQGN